MKDSIKDNSRQLSYNQGTLFNKLIWDIDDVCKITSYAKGTVYNKVSSGEIPYRRGRKRKLIFIPNEVINWLKGGTNE